MCCLVVEECVEKCGIVWFGNGVIFFGKLYIECFIFLLKVDYFCYLYIIC